MIRATAIALVLGLGLEVAAQGTMIPIPPYSGSFSGNARGFWFTCPADITIVGVEVPNEGMHAIQSFHLMVLPAAPPAYPATGLVSGTLADLHMGSLPANQLVPVNFPVANGEVFAVLGTCGTTNQNSYGTSPFMSMIGGTATTITRFGTQNPIHVNPAPDYWTEAGGSVARVELFYTEGPSCTITAPAASSMQTGQIQITYDVDHNMMLPVDALFQFSTDAGMTWSNATPAGMSVNPTTGLATPSTGLMWEWDSLADGIGLIMPQTTELRIEASDAMMQASTCTVASLDIDNVVPPPTCTLAQTVPGAVSGNATFDLLPDSMTSMTVDATFEYSLDSGTTWNLATPTGASANPETALPVATLYQFEWDSRADMVGSAALAPGVLLRATVDSGAPLTGECTTMPFDVDNTALCSTLCGDCDSNMAGPDILDALTGAQIAAGLVTPTMLQIGCCDVNASMSVDILDALGMAQAAAGLPATLMCP